MEVKDVPKMDVIQAAKDYISRFTRSTPGMKVSSSLFESLDSLRLRILLLYIGVFRVSFRSRIHIR